MDWIDRHGPKAFAAALEWSDGARAALDDMWTANNFATLALSDRAFVAYREASKAAGAPPVELVQKMGMAELLRHRLRELGWIPPA